MMSIVEDHDNDLFVTFTSDDDQLSMEKRLEDLNDDKTEIEDMLEVFDALIDKTTEILQLLYRKYVIQRFG